jgi:DNA invertase Pin-like site-specific DNA recombinase
MIIGYARVSKADKQDTKAQINILESAGAEIIFHEKASGGRWDRPELKRMLDQLRSGDVILVWKLDRLTRSLKDLLHLLDIMDKKGAGFKSITESIDTTTAPGRMMMQMLGSFAEFEREMIRERINAGLAEAKKNGKIFGRPRKLDNHQRDMIVQLVSSGQQSASQAARLFNVHPAMITRIMAHSA